MKKILILFIILTFISCSSVRQSTNKIVIHYGFDFTKYSTQGFLFTPEQYLGEYESIGIVKTIIFPAVKNKKSQIKSQTGEPFLNEEWEIEKLDADEAINEMYKKATEMGANAVVRFEIHKTQYMNGLMEIPGFEVSGFAIKRKQK